MYLDVVLVYTAVYNCNHDVILKGQGDTLLYRLAVSYHLPEIIWLTQ